MSQRRTRVSPSAFAYIISEREYASIRNVGTGLRESPRDTLLVPSSVEPPSTYASRRFRPLPFVNCSIE